MPPSVASAPPAAEPGDLRVGVAVVDATPELGVPLAGHSKRRRLLPDLDPHNAVTYFAPSTNVRDPLFAKAVVIESGGDKLFLLSLERLSGPKGLSVPSAKWT